MTRRYIAEVDTRTPDGTTDTHRAEVIASDTTTAEQALDHVEQSAAQEMPDAQITASRIRPA